MNIFSWDLSHFHDSYNILCAELVNPGLSREGIYPTFCKIPLNQKSLIHHHYEPEIFFIINGLGIMSIDGQKKEVKAGDLIHIPAFATHELVNSGDQELSFLSVYSEDFTIPALPSNAILTAAPPTPNGPLHLGHISGPYLGIDILSRYLKLRSVPVFSQSGTDDHQNYVSEGAYLKKENTVFFQSKMRSRIQKGLKNLKIQFDQFIEPCKDNVYQETVMEFVKKVIDRDIIRLETVAFPHCEHCSHFLIDVLVDGECPQCEKQSRGCCESCGIVVPPYELKNITCSRCEKKSTTKDIQVYTFNLGQYLPAIKDDLKNLKLPPRLRQFVEEMSEKNNLKVLLTYPNNGDGALSLPTDNHSLHVWFEMAAHYEFFSLSKEDWIHSFGFDNSFYYLLFIPAIHRALHQHSKLPDAVLTNEFLKLEGLKFSTSRNHAIWADEFQGNADHLRFFLSLIRPEMMTSNFNAKEFEFFSSELSLKMEKLNKAAVAVAIHSNHKVDSDCLVLCNRITRDLELFFSPTHFNLRRAAQRLLELIDICLEWCGANRNEKLLIHVFGTLLSPIMPDESKVLLKNLAISEAVWITDWVTTV